jgi:hypothetical protein
MIVSYSPFATACVAPPSNIALRPPALLSLELEEGEEVEWQWTHFVDGCSVVTGYRIVPRLLNGTF